MNNSLFAKTLESGRNHRDNKFIRTEARRNHLVTELNLINLN